MSLQKRNSLKFKLGFFATLLVVFVAISFGFFVLQGQRRAIVKTQENNRLNILKDLRQVATQAILVYDDTDIINYVKHLKKQATTSYAMILSPDGRIRVHTDPMMMDKKVDDEATKKALGYRDEQKPLIQNLTGPDGRAVIDMSLPLSLGTGASHYEGVVRIGYDKKEYEEIIHKAFREEFNRLMGAFLLTLVVGLVGAFMLAAYITKPLSSLQEGSRLIGEGKLHHRIQINTNDELQELADEFNLMGQKLGELDEMKRDFVSSVTHELRSPMTSIKGYMNLLLQGAAGNLSELQRDYLSVIKNNAVRLGRFIDNLLDISKIEAQKLNLSPEPHSVAETIHEMTVLFKPQADEKKISFKVELPKSLSAAFVDKDKLSEVLINLTSNAIKFTPERGTITFLAQEAPDYIEMAVADTGEGVPADQTEKIFSKFEQVKSNQKGKIQSQKGTGLGLAIVKGIVEAHGGKIWVKSPGPSGKGTVFYFTIPKLTDEIKRKLEQNV